MFDELHHFGDSSCQDVRVGMVFLATSAADKSVSSHWR